MPTPHAPRVTRWVLRPIEDVYDVLADPGTYPSWLVGCRAIRSIDVDWPDEGSHFHHRVGIVGPLAVNDSTESLAATRPSHLALEVRFRPLGRGRVDFWLTDEPDPLGLSRTRIDMDEAPVGPLAAASSVLAPLIKSRNQASLNSFVAHLNEPLAQRSDRT